MRFRCTGSLGFITLRAKIVLACLGLTAITAGLGFGAIHGIEASGRLVMQVYDGPLMANTLVGNAESDFSAMRLALERREVVGNPEQDRQQFGQRLAGLARQMEDDLGAAREQAASIPAADAARQALDDFRGWNDLRTQAAGAGGPSDGALQDSMHRQARTLLGALDRLRQMTADDWIGSRARMLDSIQRYRLWLTGATAAALLIGMLIAIVLARHIVPPIIATARAARRTAAGELDATIPVAGHDERNVVENEAAAPRSVQGHVWSAIEGLNEGFALVDADRRVILANSRLAAFFPRPAAFVVNAVLSPETEAMLAANPAGELQLADGRWLRLSRSARADGSFVLIVSDITPLKQREALLQAAKEQAEAANREKTRFLTNMSHELRTPLTAIIGFSEIIANEWFGSLGQPKYRDFAADILHSGQHLLDVVNDMLDIGKLQSGTTELRLQPVPSRSVVDAALRIVRTKAERAGIRLEVAMPRDLPILEADPVRLRQVLLNLLSNAIKFTPAGGTVSVIAEVHAATLAVTVCDTGIGMAPEDIPRALQPFVQVGNDLGSEHRGTGLGLPLSKLFVELHGGTFEVRSAQGKGTAVTVTLPVAYAAPLGSEREVAA